ncbi:GT2 family glycosyltransferase [Geodermatophilus bullaregiensis]|uniref:glycosyltransferase family 2 protein n=1 Tax=Geodermatophilus bullaregiensis TaxID=1564160 RepID=UPI001958E6F3|nr:GT2 family glycosyltransferase [Geodermatophilus bullaregiensis]
MEHSEPNVTVVLTCYTEDRWDSIARAIAAVHAQSRPCSLVVVVDHAPRLLERLCAHAGPNVVVVANRFPPGASGGRNTGADTATTPLLAFLDDDQEPEADWLANLVTAYARYPRAVGLGGAILPVWPNDPPPWFPPAFSWVIGATTPGQPAGDVRNVWGGNTLVERTAFLAAGGYNTSFGKVGALSEPEDTELCLRMSALTGLGARWRFVPEAVVRHRVPPERATFTFFVRRCWLEGRGKRAMVTLGSGRDLGDEAAFARQVLTRGVLADFCSVLRGERAGAQRAAAAMIGTLTAAVAFTLPVRVRTQGEHLLDLAASGIPALDDTSGPRDT